MRILSSPVLLVMSGFVIVLIPWILFVTVVVIGGFVWALPRLFVFEDYSDWGMFLDGEALWILKATQGSGCREPSPGQRLEGVLPGKS